MPEYVTAKDIAEFFNIAEATVYRLAKAGQIPGIRIGKLWRFDIEKVKKALFSGLEEEQPSAN